MAGEPVPGEGPDPRLSRAQPGGHLARGRCQGNLLYEYKEPRTQASDQPRSWPISSPTSCPITTRVPMPWGRIAPSSSRARLPPRPARPRTFTTPGRSAIRPISSSASGWATATTRRWKRCLRVAAAGPIYHGVMEYLFNSPCRRSSFVEPPGWSDRWWRPIWLAADATIRPTNAARSLSRAPAPPPTITSTAPSASATSRASWPRCIARWSASRKRSSRSTRPTQRTGCVRSSCHSRRLDYCHVHGAGPINADVAIISPDDLFLRARHRAGHRQCQARRFQLLAAAIRRRA